MKSNASLSLEWLEPRDAPGSLDPLLEVLNSLPQTPPPGRACTRVTARPFPQVEAYLNSGSVRWNATLTDFGGNAYFNFSRNACNNNNDPATLTLFVSVPPPGTYNQFGSAAQITTQTGTATIEEKPAQTGTTGGFLLHTTHGTSQDNYFFDVHWPVLNHYTMWEGQEPGDYQVFGGYIHLRATVEAINGFGTFDDRAEVKPYLYNFTTQQWTNLIGGNTLVLDRYTWFVRVQSLGVYLAADYTEQGCAAIWWKMTPLVPGHGETTNLNYGICP